VLPLLVMLTITGGLINAVQTTMYALAAPRLPERGPRDRRRDGRVDRPHRRDPEWLRRRLGD
jgi:hypothetical protein